MKAVYGFVGRGRKERIIYIREFKKGKCVAVYLIAIPLFFIGYNYVQEGHGAAIRRGAGDINSRAYNMAYQEHLRWNAYMMSYGIVPADKDTILNEKDSRGRFTNGNSYEERHHGNLTDFDGLWYL